MTKWSKRVGIRTMGLALFLPMGLAGQQPPAITQEPYEVGRAAPPLESGGSMVEMSLEDAIARALEANLDLQSARLNPVIQAYALRAAHGAFTPTLSTSYSYNNSSNQSTSQLDGGSRTTTQRQSFNTSITKPFPWYGGRLSANFNNSRTATNNVFATRNPSYSSSLSLNYSMPLLAGFRIDNQRASLETAEIQSRITDLQLESQIENIKAQVRQAYWSLRSAIEQIEIQRRSLAQAQQLLTENQTRARLGRMTEYQVIQAEAQVASAQQSFLNAQIQWSNQEFAFKQLLLGGADDPLLGQTVNPTDLPTIVTQEVDIEAAIERARAQRIDMRQQRQQREITVTNLSVTRSNALPDLTLSASYSLSGVGGNRFERDQLGGEPVLIDEGGYFDGIRSILDLDTPTWSVSLNASYPIGTNVAKTSLERAELQLRQADLATRSQELTVITQVTTAGLAVRNSYLQLEAARRNREAAERNAEAEMLRLDVGVATNFEVVQAQNAMTSARLSELQAIINHVNAIAEFDRVQRVGG